MQNIIQTNMQQSQGDYVESRGMDSDAELIKRLKF